MPSLDVFKGNAFSVIELTESINRAPYNPGRLGALGVFTPKPVRTTYVELIRKGATISLLPTKERGAPGTTKSPDKRAARLFKIPHIPYDAPILADSIQNIRAYGPNDELMAVSDIVNETMDAMRQDHEVTHEWHRIGALKGVILDADGTTTLLDLFAEFGISETSVDFLLGTSTTDVKGKCETVRRAMETALGGLAFKGIHALCGDTFWDKLTTHATVVDSYRATTNSNFMRESQRLPFYTGGFEHCGIFFENYRGKVGSTNFIGASDCRFYPEGVQSLFIEHYGPSDTMDGVNQPGQVVYAMQEPLQGNKGVNLLTQSNPLMLCTRPEVLIKGTTSN